MSRGNFKIEPMSAIALRRLVKRYKERYPTQNEFATTVNIRFKINGVSSEKEVNNVFDKLWYVDYGQTFRVWVQRMQVQHLEGSRNANISFKTVRFDFADSIDDGSQNPTVTVIENLLRAYNDGDGTKFLSDDGTYKKIDVGTGGSGGEEQPGEGEQENVYEEIFEGMKVYKIDTRSLTNNEVVSPEIETQLRAIRKDMDNGELIMVFSSFRSAQYVQVNFPRAVFASSYKENDNTTFNTYLTFLSNIFNFGYPDKQEDRPYAAPLENVSYEYFTLNSENKLVYHSDYLTLTWNLDNSKYFNMINIGEIALVEHSGNITAEVDKVIENMVELATRNNRISLPYVVDVKGNGNFGTGTHYMDILPCVLYGKASAGSPNDSFTLRSLLPVNGSNIGFKFTCVSQGNYTVEKVE